ncbi:fumarylacetoacetate hydrolase [Mycolicibacterium wolinskyi]|uniref:Fumarylacetoacetate hydrolase n=1 Tax=Mycolicibacterium wolinskyi TaxID=59750 RepID=A0A132PTE7_9MYCO|nr:fumarylacetoacetate hydrolase family protein [Mycolicibacterium wolinskyi]KWX25593.1 fumarylacetoacetate hydrolase [Mycolicibacterium wolinskyi]
MPLTQPWPPTAATTLPADHQRAALVGRVFRADVGGPSVVTVRDGELVDITATFPTMRDLAEHPDPADAVGCATGERIGPLADALATTPPEYASPQQNRLLSPIDLQCVKAAGVTFVASMLERMIEERSRGDAEKAEHFRRHIVELTGAHLADIAPGSAAAARIKELLVAEDAWSQYLEVGIGPDAEIFTKTAPMSSVGTAVDIGVHPRSTWNNPEPEVVLLVSSTRRIVGATLGNDVNLRDFEGRSALLLTKAKDNNASCAIGPFVRLFDDGFDLDTVRNCDVELRVHGRDGFVLDGRSSMKQISRDPEELVAQLTATHQYPDGAVLFLGTMFAPTDDRDAPGQGFTHHVDDLVTISSPTLGTLVNRVRTSDQVAPWTFGTADLFRNLATRKLL